MWSFQNSCQMSNRCEYQTRASNWIFRNQVMKLLKITKNEPRILRKWQFCTEWKSLRNPDHKILFGVWNDQNSLRNGNVTLTLAHKKQIRNEVTNLLKIAKNIENPFRKMSYLHRVIVAECWPWNPIWCMKRWEFAKLLHSDVLWAYLVEYYTLNFATLYVQWRNTLKKSQKWNNEI